MYVQCSDAAFRELVIAWTGIKNPPPWLICALGNMPYKVNVASVLVW